MNEFAKLLIIFGLVLAGIGLLIMLFGKLNIPIGRLPGDIVYKNGNFVFYFPIVSSIILSILLTILLNIIFRR
ncbi:DUF2905 domain-containing protein [Hydrogenobaculum acidophilum]